MKRLFKNAILIVCSAFCFIFVVGCSENTRKEMLIKNERVEDQSFTFSGIKYSGYYKGDYDVNNNCRHGNGKFVSDDGNFIAEGKWDDNSFMEGKLTEYSGSNEVTVWDLKYGDRTAYCIKHVKDGKDLLNPEKPSTAAYDPSKIVVYIPQNGGKKYHSNSSCSGMKNPIAVTLEDARNAGYEGCDKCN